MIFSHLHWSDLDKKSIQPQNKQMPSYIELLPGPSLPGEWPDGSVSVLFSFACSLVFLFMLGFVQF